MNMDISKRLQVKKSLEGTDLNFPPKLFLQITQKSWIGGQSILSLLFQKKGKRTKRHMKCEVIMGNCRDITKFKI